MSNYNKPTGSGKFFSDKSYNNISDTSKDSYNPPAGDPAEGSYGYTPSAGGGLKAVFKFLFKTFLVLFGIYCVGAFFVGVFSSIFS